MPGDPGFGRGPDLRLMAAKGRSINTRRQILQPDEAPRFQGRRGLGSGPGIARPTRGVAPYYSRAAQGQAEPGGGLDIPELTDIPGVSRVATAPSIMEMLGGPGPSDEAKKMAFNVIGESFIPGGGALRAAKGLNFAERMLSRAPRIGRATTDRGPVNPALVQHLLSSEINPSMYPLRGRPAFPGNPLDPRNRTRLENMVQGADLSPPGVMGAMNEYADQLPNMLAPRIPRRPNRLSPDQNIDELELAAAHEDPSVVEELMQGGLGTPQMGGVRPGDDLLARILMEELGGTKPRMTRFGEQSLQGLAPLAALGGGGTYGWQQRQRQPQPVPQQVRRRMPYMLSDNWR